MLIDSHILNKVIYFLGDIIMISWLRNSKVAMWVLTIARVYLGFQ